MFAWTSEQSGKIERAGDVEIEESAFGKRKFNRGGLTNTKWVVGEIYCTKNLFFSHSATLNRVPLENVKQGSIIHTYCWRSYSNLVNERKSLGEKSRGNEILEKKQMKEKAAEKKSGKEKAEENKLIIINK